MKPYRLRRWRSSSSPERIRFFTCARPGRSGRDESRFDRVADDVVHLWVRGLPDGEEAVIVSLLGRKNGPDGMSEFSFYSFHGGWDLPVERRGRPSFEEWLQRWHKNRRIKVLEHPTYDFRRIPQETLRAVASDVLRELSAGRTVVLIDSGGEQRTGQVCRYMGFIEDSRRA